MRKLFNFIDRVNGKLETGFMRGIKLFSSYSDTMIAALFGNLFALLVVVLIHYLSDSWALAYFIAYTTYFWGVLSFWAVDYRKNNYEI